MSTAWKPSPSTDTRFHTIEIVDETGSTNADLLERAPSGLTEGEVLIARHQTAGRGRQGRTWLDQPDAALLMSVSLQPSIEVAPLIPLVVGSAVARTLDSIGATVGLKWPNDVLAPAHGERKVAGILAEATSVKGRFFVVVGMGINLAFVEQPPPDVADKAIDLQTLLGERTRIDRRTLVSQLLAEIDSGLTELEEQGGARALDSYRKWCRTLGRLVRFETGTRTVSGRAVDIDPGGGLVVEDEADRSRTVLTAGDAHHA